jgi:hypothetical protein
VGVHQETFHYTAADMKPLDSVEFIPYLLETEWAKEQLGVYNNKFNAVMVVPFKPEPDQPAVMLRVIAASGGGWDHVSISLPDRTPRWEELEFVKRLLFKPHEIAVQFHVPADDHINVHPYTLHLWRHHTRRFPLPPKRFV